MLFFVNPYKSKNIWRNVIISHTSLNTKKEITHVEKTVHFVVTVYDKHIL